MKPVAPVTATDDPDIYKLSVARLD
jgi:hypothetical protein